MRYRISYLLVCVFLACATCWADKCECKDLRYIIPQEAAGNSSSADIPKSQYRLNMLWKAGDKILFPALLLATALTVTLIYLAINIHERRRAEKKVRNLNTELEEKEKSSIQELEKNLQTLKDSEKKYHKLFNEGMDPIFIAEWDTGILTDCNKAAEKLMGTPREEIIGLNHKYLHPEEEWKDDSARAFIVHADGMEVPLESKIITKSGKERYVTIKGSIFEHEGKKYMQGIFRDITEQKVAERQLQEAKKQAEDANKVKSAFLANISHEIRTPLSSILGFTDVLGKHITTDKQKQYLQAIKSSSKTLLHVLNDILDMSKVEAGKLELKYSPVDLREIIRDIQTIFLEAIRKQGVKLFVEFPENFPERIITDELRLRQILLNLVSNAVKFTEKGYIKIAVSCVPSQEEEILSSLTIQVEDTGLGVPFEEQNNIFKPFEQHKDPARPRGGTGLGLAITKNLAERMGGEISLFSIPGSGSVFTLKFKNLVTKDSNKETPPPVAGNNTITPQPQTPDFPRKVLIADDHQININLIKAFLMGHDTTVLEARNGSDALEKAIGGKPDLILMDIHMPGMSGYEAAELIKKEETTNSIPIIAVTASVDPAGLDPEYEKLFASCIMKPVVQEKLFEAIESVWKKQA